MIEIKPYHPEYEEGIRSLFVIPVSGDIALSLEREPSYLAGAHIQTEVPQVFVCIDSPNNTVVAVFNVGHRRVYLGGLIQYAPYFCDLRIHTDYQQGTLFLKIIRYLDQVCPDLNEVPALTVVFSDNHRMIRMIKKRLISKKTSTIPYYHEIATLETHFFRWNKKNIGNDPTIFIRRAGPEDIDQMMHLQSEIEKHDYHPFYDFKKTGVDQYYSGLQITDFFLAFKGEILCGICGTWDLSDIKQTVVRSYSTRLKLIRPLYNIFASHLLNYPVLPALGEKLKTISLHSIMIRKRDVNIFRQLIDFIAPEVLIHKSLSLMCTLDRRDILNDVFKNVPNKITKMGKVYLVNVNPFLDKKYLKGYMRIDGPRI